MDEKTIHLEDYLYIILKHRWTIISFFVITVTTVLIGTYRTRPVYRATATILIEKEYTSAQYKEQISIDFSQADYYQSQYNIMKSRTLAKKVIDELKLDKLDEFKDSPDIVSSFLKNITVEPVRNTRLVQLSADSYSPELSAKIANTLAEAYVQQNLQYRLAASREILKKIPLNGLSSKNLTEQIGSVESLPSVVNNPLIQELKALYVKLESEYADLSRRYKPKHPQMIRIKAKLDETKQRIDNEIKNIVESIKIELSGDLKANNVRIIDPAEVPKMPYKPNKKTNTIFAIFVGFFGGIGLAFFFEYLDNTVKTEEDVEEYLGLPFLGFIPKVKFKDKTKQKREKYFADKIVFYEPLSQASEAIKTIMSNLQFSGPKENLKKILITSTSPEEGKSFVVSNLSISFALTGLKTVIIDCDLRRSTLHKIFQVPNEKGITEYLVGQIDSEQIIKKTEVENLYIITAGHHPPNPVELLSQERLKTLFNTLSERFDRIIIDSPPCLPVSDSRILANISNGVVLVARHGKISKTIIKTGKQALVDVGAKIFGVILNNIDFETHSGYYYPYYHYRYYHYYPPKQKE